LDNKNKFKELPLINELQNEFFGYSKIDLNEIAIVSVQHILETTGSLFESLIEYGFNKMNIFCSGKFYSTNNIVEKKIKLLEINYIDFSDTLKDLDFDNVFNKQIEKLWENFMRSSAFRNCKYLIVLDEGGHCLSSIPDIVQNKFKIVGIEQTRGGLYLRDTFANIPIIEIATSAAKTILEPYLISKTNYNIINKKIDLTRKLKMGIIGVGSLGMAFGNYLISKGHEIIAYDKDITHLNRLNCTKANSINDVISNSEVVFGCTGNDISQKEWVYEIKKDITLISISSKNTEFKLLIKEIFKKSKLFPKCSLDDITFNNIIIKRGGFPLNFDGSTHSVPPYEIQLTRALIFSSIIQAIHFLEIKKPNDFYMLNPEFQRFIVKKWFKVFPESKSYYSQKQKSIFTENDSIIRFSRGTL